MGLRTTMSICASSVSARPFQNCLKLSAALSTVGVLTCVGWPRKPSERARGSPPPRATSWQLAQDTLLLADRRASLNRRRPSAALAGSWCSVSGTGLIGSSSGASAAAPGGALQHSAIASAQAGCLVRVVMSGSFHAAPAPPGPPRATAGAGRRRRPRWSARGKRRASGAASPQGWLSGRRRLAAGPLALGWPRRLACSCRLPVLAIAAYRQSDAEGAALAQLGMDLDAAAVPVDDVARQRQAQAGALAGRLGGEEGVEDVCEVARRDAGAGVADGEPDVVVIAAGAQRDAAARRGDGMDGVDDQVQHHLVDLRRAAQHRRQ